MRRIRTILTGIVTVTVFASSGATVQGQDFSTPEAAVREYLAGFAAGDLDRVLAASSVDEAAEGYRLDVAVERVGGYAPLTFDAPPNHPFFADLNRLGLSQSIGAHVRNLAYSLLLPDVDLGAAIAPVDHARLDDLMGRLDPARLAPLEVLDVGIGAPDLLLTDRTQEIFTQQAATYGADEQTERVALIEFEGDRYWLGFTLLRYDDAWQVAWHVATLAGSHPAGLPEPITLEEYEELTSAG